jgi:hypothetical protein
MNFGNKQPASKIARSIVTQIATAQTNATQFTTPFGSQTRYVRLASTLALWITIDSTAVVTANSAAAFIPANTPEYFGAELHQHQHIDRLRLAHGDDLGRQLTTGKRLPSNSKSRVPLITAHRALLLSHGDGWLPLRVTLER